MISFRRASAPLALLALCLLAFLPMIYRLGFYWDDWPSVWFYHMWGPAGFLEGFASDRPALAWVFMLTTSVFGENAAAWQVFGLFARWLAALAFWWTLLGVWPRNSRPVFWAAALFAVYPGFSQQYISVTYSNAYLVYTLALVSFGAMVWAYRKPEAFWPLTVLALLAQGFSLAMTEYFFGLELLRPALLLLAMQAAGGGAAALRSTARRVFGRWLPYLLVFAPFLIDRIFFHKTPRGEITLFSQMAAQPLQAAMELAKTVAGDFIEVNVLAWGWRLDPGILKDYDASITRMFAGIVAATLALSLFYLLRQRETPAGAELHEGGEAEPAIGERPLPIAAWGRQAIGLGVYAFFTSNAIIWATNLHIQLLFPWDRFTLIAMFGACLFVAGAAALVGRRAWVPALLLSALLALAAGLQFQHRLVYRQEWLAQRNFLWQLAWRAPAIEPGTLLMTSELPFLYYTDNSLTAPLNWMYAPENRSTEMAYLLYDVEARLGVELPAIAAGLPVDMRYRATTFRGSTSKAIVLFYDPPRCLKIVDPEVDRFLPVKPLYIREMTSLSRPELVLAEGEQAAAPPESLFGVEPAHAWCYYFEKAELYNQYGEYEKAAEAADRALKITKQFTDKNVSELFAFIEAYAHTGKWNRAVELSLQAFQIWDKTQYPLCDVWARIEAETQAGGGQQAAVQKVKESLKCRMP